MMRHSSKAALLLWREQSICGEGCELVTVLSSARVVFRLPAPGKTNFPDCKAGGSTEHFQSETVIPVIFRACSENWCLGKVYETEKTAGEIGLWGENAHLRAGLVQKQGSWQGEAADCLLPPKVTQGAGHIYLAG